MFHSSPSDAHVASDTAPPFFVPSDIVGNKEPVKETPTFDDEDVLEDNLYSRYHIEGTLGAGAYGICHKARCKRTSDVRAVKTIFKTRPQSIAWAEEEVRIM